MKKIQYNIYERVTNNASGKAKSDVAKILLNNGYKKLYSPSRYRLIRIIQQFFSILFLPKNALFFIQYKANTSFFYQLLQFKKKIKKIAIIHDLESLQKQAMSIEKEANLLNSFDYIISHNSYMTKYLKDHGVRSAIVDLNIFDYLIDDKITINNSFAQNEVFFAGNLFKSLFLSHLSEVEGVVFNLYGLEFDGIEKIKEQHNVHYKGSFTPEALIPNVEGGWGLVWDGDSLITCSGVSGDYLKYNNPHKVSMCIVCERPVIIWNKAAMADYIVNHGLGISVDSLKDLKNVLAGISLDHYLAMKENVKNEKKRLRNGNSLKDAIKKINACIQ